MGTVGSLVFGPSTSTSPTAGRTASNFDARVEVVEYLGDEQLVHLTRKDTAIQAKLPIEEQVSAGQELKLTVPRDKLLLFDAETGERIPG